MEDIGFGNKKEKNPKCWYLLAIPLVIYFVASSIETCVQTVHEINKREQ